MSLENNEEIIVDIDESVEGELDSGSVDSSDDDEGKVSKPERKRGNNTDKRIKTLSGRTNDAERKAAAAEKFAQEESKRARMMETISTDFAEEAFKAQREITLMKLKDAKLRDDIDAETQLVSELSAIDSKFSDLNRYKNETKNREQNSTPTSVIEQVPAQDNSLDGYYERGTPATKKFIDENRDWLDTNSEDHDSEKAQDVISFAAKLEKELKNQGRGAEIETKAYYNRINQYIKDNWDDDTVEEKTTKKTFGGASYSTPVGSRSQSSQRTSDKTVIKLSADERDIALGSTRKRPNGTEFTDAEKLRNYYINKQNKKV